MRTLTKFSVALLVTITASFLFWTGGAYAANLSTPLTFAIGTPGKTGCLVCHGDPQIIAVKKMKQSLYVSPDTVAKSVHKDVACISCHTDFKLLSASQDHAKIVDFNKTAGISCKNCHQHVNQLREYSQSTHGRLALTGSPKPAPTCADCHGSHDIRSLKKDEAYKDAFHLAGMDVCGKCHKAYADAYNDYYHGRAYKAKATDAPACWDCHGSHQIKPAKDPTSLVSTQRLAKTCGKCHIDSQANFSTQYGPMIHGSQKTLKSTIVMTYLDKALSFIDPMLDSVNGYYKSIVGSLFYRER